MSTTTLKTKKFILLTKKRLTGCFCCHVFVTIYCLMLCTLIGAIILSINIQVGLNMHLYDIGDASSSLRGSTSSWAISAHHFGSECKIRNLVPLENSHSGLSNSAILLILILATF